MTKAKRTQQASPTSSFWLTYSTYLYFNSHLCSMTKTKRTQQASPTCSLGLMINHCNQSHNPQSPQEVLPAPWVFGPTNPNPTIHNPIRKSYLLLGVFGPKNPTNPQPNQSTIPPESPTCSLGLMTNQSTIPPGSPTCSLGLCTTWPRSRTTGSVISGKH